MEAERKKQKAASSFVSFFKKTVELKLVEKPKEVEMRNFMPFEVKPDMKIAPIVRLALTETHKKELEALLMSDKEINHLYLDILKSKNYQVKKSGHTWPFEGKDVIIIGKRTYLKFEVPF